MYSQIVLNLKKPLKDDKPKEFLTKIIGANNTSKNKIKDNIIFFNFSVYSTSIIFVHNNINYCVIGLYQSNQCLIIHLESVNQKENFGELKHSIGVFIKTIKENPGYSLIKSIQIDLLAGQDGFKIGIGKLTNFKDIVKDLFYTNHWLKLIAISPIIVFPGLFGELNNFWYYLSGPLITVVAWLVLNYFKFKRTIRYIL